MTISIGDTALHGHRRSRRHASELFIAYTEAAENRRLCHVRVGFQQETAVQVEDRSRLRRAQIS